MCGRFTLKTSPQQVAALFDDLDVELPKFKPRYNIAPTQQVLAVRAGTDTPAEAVTLRWGLVPFWAKDASIGARMINARSETIAEKPSFRAAFKSRRCLIVADGFFEWKANGKRKQPYHVTLPDQQPFCFAGLWESWRDKQSSDTELQTCTIITAAANESIQALHDRMPCVVPRSAYSTWLDATFEQPTSLLDQLTSDSPEWTYQPVNPIVNNARQDSPACIEPIG